MDDDFIEFDDGYGNEYIEERDGFGGEVIIERDMFGDEVIIERDNGFGGFGGPEVVIDIGGGNYNNNYHHHQGYNNGHHHGHHHGHHQGYNQQPVYINQGPTYVAPPQNNYQQMGGVPGYQGQNGGYIVQPPMNNAPIIIQPNQVPINPAIVAQAHQQNFPEYWPENAILVTCPQCYNSKHTQVNRKMKEQVLCCLIFMLFFFWTGIGQIIALCICCNESNYYTEHSCGFCGHRFGKSSCCD